MQNPSHTCPQCHSPIPTDAPGGLCPACVLLGVAGPTNPSQASATNAPTIEEVGAAFPELEVLELIGQGGMGVVFKARQPRLDRLVALKILPPALAAQPGFSERFTREARVLAKLAHPHIVSIYDFGESAGFFYFIMEFVNGVNLRAAMRAGVKPEQALLLVPHICEALQFAHDHGVLHRDIKPENILLDTTGTPKLADFGIAKLAGEESMTTGLTATGAALGTAAYMAPEQVEKPATVDHRADIYSLGVVLYELLTGELPLGRFGAPSEKSPVNRGVDEVVMRALEKERERRQQSATEMKTQVEGATHGGTRPVAARPIVESQDGLVTRIFIALAGLSAAGIPLAGMLGWHAPNSRHMIVFAILFGTLAALSKLFTPAPNPAARTNEERGFVPRDPVRATQAQPLNPWPRRLFVLVAALILVPVMIGIGLVIPMFAYWSLERPAPATNARSASVDVHYSPADPKLPGIHKLTLNSRTPYGWVTDFSFRIRDEKGERELPYASFIVAQQPPAQPHSAPELNAEISWEFNTRDMVDGYFQLNAKLNKGSVGNAGGSTSEATAFRWEPSLGRSEWRRSLVAEAPSQIFFLRGLPMGAGIPAKPEAEMYVLVKIRPMQPGEKAVGFQGFIGPDRFEKLIPIETQHDNAIRRAAQQLDETRARIKARVPVTMPLESAELALAIAEARGDETKVAEARIAFAEAQHRAVKARVDAGTATPAEAAKTEQDLNIARIRLQEARNKADIEKPSMP